MEPQENQETQSISIAQALEILAGGAVTAQHGWLGWSSNNALLVTVTSPAAELLGVYKPRRVERPLWDFPHGTLCNREVAAFLVSAALGWDIVPPTVLRDGPKGPGSVQLFVHHDPDIHYFTLQDDPAYTFRFQQFAAFDAVTNNADRKGGHFILDSQDHLWGIDHGLTFNTAPKLRTVMWDFAGQPLPAPILANLETLLEALAPGQSLPHALETLLSQHEIRKTQARIKRLLTDKCFPTPGPGPNYPWPPV
jgi:hypothetical protein